MVRRNRPPVRADLFDQTKSSHWLVAEDPWRKILELRPLPPGTDLMRAFLVELLRYHDLGWRLSEFKSFGASFYATKEYEAKRYVYIASEDPSVPLASQVEFKTDEFRVRRHRSEERDDEF